MQEEIIFLSYKTRKLIFNKKILDQAVLTYAVLKVRQQMVIAQYMTRAKNVSYSQHRASQQHGWK